MEARKYIALVRRRWLPILLAAVLIGGATFIFNSHQVKMYRATAEFMIDVAAGSGSQREYAGQLIAEGLVQDYIQIIPTKPIAANVIDRLSVQYPEMRHWQPHHLLTMVNLTSPFETQIIHITVVDRDPQRAADIANTIGIVFSEVNAERSKSRFSVPIDKLDSQLALLDTNISLIEVEISQFSEVQTGIAVAERSQLERTLNELQMNYNTVFQTRLDLDIEQARSLNNFLEIEPAVPQLRPISPRTNTNSLLAAGVAIFLALGFILLLDYLDDTVKDRTEVFETTKLASLATIAYIDGGTPPDRLVVHNAPRNPISEAYRMLRTNLSFASISTDIKCVLVTSSSPGEGKSTTSANLAAVLAQTGRRVVLIDADMRRPSQHTIFELSNNYGLTTALLNKEERASQYLQTTKVPNLRLMSSGPLPPNPAELLYSERMQALLQELEKEADFVLLDTPPVLTVADASILSTCVHGSILVAEVGRTQLDMLVKSAERMRHAGANMLGLVLNRHNTHAAGYYYYTNKEYVQNSGPTESYGRLASRRIITTLFN